MSISNAMLLRFASGVPYGFRDRQRFELVPEITSKKMCKQRSQQSDQSCFCTNTRPTHEAEQALPAWRGAGRSSRGTRPLLSSSDGAGSCHIPLLCLLLYC